MEENKDIYEFFLSLKDYVWDTNTQEKFEEYILKLYNKLNIQ